MIEGALEFPKINYSKFWMGIIIAVLICFLNQLQFAKIFGSSIWPLTTIFLLPAWSRIGLNIISILSLFVLGLIQDFIFGQEIGIFATINLIAFGILLAFKSYGPPMAKNSGLEAIISSLIYLTAILLFGIFTQNIPNLIGLLIPIISSGFILYKSNDFFEILAQNS